MPSCMKMESILRKEGKRERKKRGGGIKGRWDRKGERRREESATETLGA